MILPVLAISNATAAHTITLVKKSMKKGSGLDFMTLHEHCNYYYSDWISLWQANSMSVHTHGRLPIFGLPVYDTGFFRDTNSCVNVEFSIRLSRSNFFLI